MKLTPPYSAPLQVPLPRFHRLDDCRGIQVRDVPGGRRRVRVTKLNLNNMDWRSFAGQFISVGVTQAVGVDPFFDASLACKSGQQLSHIGCFHRPALQRAENRGTAVDANSRSAVQPKLQDGPRAGVQANNPAFIIFPVQHPNGAGLGVQVFGHQRQRLGNAQASAIEDDDQSLVAYAGDGSLGAGSYQYFDFLFVKRFGRQRAALVCRNLGGTHGTHGIFPQKCGYAFGTKRNPIAMVIAQFNNVK